MLDMIIHGGFVITMRGKGVGLIEDGAVGIKGNIIKAVGDTQELLKRYKAHRYIDANHKAVMPGLIDAHIHSSMALIRGVAQDTKDWLQRGIGPFMRSMTDEEAVKGSILNAVEALKNGTTTLCDYDNPMNLLVENYKKLGIRARVASMIHELPKNLHTLEIDELYPFDHAIGEKRLKENIELIEKHHGTENGRITCVLGPQGPDMISKDLLLEIKELARKYSTMLYMHVAQGDREIRQMIRRYGMRSIEYLERLELLNEKMIAVHLTEATKTEVQLVAKKKAKMVFCPGSIGIIDGLVPPLLEYMNITEYAALGSDQAPGNNCNNMFNEMKFAAILNKVKMKDPTILPAWKALRLATIEAAKTIGLENEIGSLEIGKKADILLIDLLSPNLCPTIAYPVRNIVPNLVYSARGNEVDMVIIDGKIVVENKKVLTVDEKEVVKEAQIAANQLVHRAAKDFIASGANTINMMKNGYL